MVKLWSPSKVYMPGDVVEFGGKVWRKRPEPGLWDPWTWQPVQVTGDNNAG